MLLQMAAIMRILPTGPAALLRGAVAKIDGWELFRSLTELQRC